MASSLSKFSGVARKRSYLIRCENGERWGGVGGGRGDERGFLYYFREGTCRECSRRIAFGRVILERMEIRRDLCLIRNSEPDRHCNLFPLLFVADNSTVFRREFFNFLPFYFYLFTYDLIKKLSRILRNCLSFFF